jgi:ferredoxin
VLDEVREVMTVNEAMCKGCGGCNAVCPSGAATMKHFRDRQVYSQIEALLQRAVPMEFVDLGFGEIGAGEEPEAVEEEAEAAPAAVEAAEAAAPAAGVGEAEAVKVE